MDGCSRRWAILVAGWLAFLVYAYPGFMSPDSLLQLDMARSGHIGDWHPPLMSYLWRLCEYALAGPFPMLVLQSVALLLGLDSLLRRFMAPRRAAIVAVVILLYPPVMTTMAVIWKDSQMAGYLLAGTAALLSTRRRWKIAGCVLMLVATAVRYNALAATLPLVVLLFVWSDAWSGWRRYALALAVWVAITLGATAANSLVTSYKDYPWHNSVAMFDIAGTIRYAHERDDRVLRDVLAGMRLANPDDIYVHVRRVYTPNEHYHLTHEDDRVFDFPRNEPELAAVKSAWFRVITTYPRAYLGHRWKVFRRCLGLVDELPSGAVWGETPEHSRIQALWLRALHAVEGELPFRVYLYLVLALAMLPLCRRSRLLFALLASGLSCELSLFIGAPSPDYRYSHWLVTVTVIVFAALVATRMTQGRRS